MNAANQALAAFAPPQRQEDASVSSMFRILAAFVGAAVFATAVRWVILLAQMQSGKTETFLLVAVEKLRLRQVENIVIFSGNTETDLRDQLKAQLALGSKFCRKYKKYLALVVGMEDEDERDDLIELLMTKVRLVWGCELNSYSGPTTNTLFIWDEAHHAQSQKQRPDKFLQKIGVSADGNLACLERNGNFMMTISATPFSELSDNLRKDQGKFVVKMQPADGYVSVKQIRDSMRIRSFSKLEGGLTEALNLRKSTKSYGIIRVSQKNEDSVRAVVEQNGWRWVVYDSVSPNRAERALGEETWKTMDKIPSEHTAILIRGKCRMGKNLHKEHLSFVFETAKNSKTDTVLQSLLGRVCGYSAGSDRVLVYLHAKILHSGEIDRYVDLWENDGVQVLPSRGNNLTDKRVKLHVPIVPIRIRINRTAFATNDRRDILNAVKHAFSTGEGLQNKNSAAAFEEVRHKVLTNESRHLNCHYLCLRKHHNEIRAHELLDAHERSVARDFGSGGGQSSVEGNEVKIWVPKNVPGFDPNVAYVSAHVQREDMGDYYIPATTGLEVFAHRLEDGTVEEGNGGMTIRLSSHTARNEAAMQEELCRMIDISRSTEGCERRIASCWDDNEQEFKGILVSTEIYNQLQKGGAIYQHIRQRYQRELHTCKTSGRTPKELAAKGFIKLASISW